MKIKKYGPQMKEMKHAGERYSAIAAKLGLTYGQVQGYFKRSRQEQRQRGYPRSRKPDEKKTNQALRKELKSLRMELELLRDFMDVLEGR